MRRLRILQIFSRYLQYGGEEGSVFRIGDSLQQNHDVEYFIGSTNELLGENGMDRISAPFRAFYNLPVAQRLRRYQELGQFDLWQIHNVLPGLSPSVYQTAFELKVPVVHYLHNYRISCTNGLFLNHGQPCERCLYGNFWPAFQTACWHDSHLISGMMGLILRRIRSIGTFHKVGAWIALCHSHKAKHVEMGIPEKRIHVIPHFYKPKESPPPPCPNGDVLFLGRLSREKGVEALLHAWKLVQSKGRFLNICGEGPEIASLKNTVSLLNITHVRFLGFVKPPDQAQLWSSTSFAVIPSIVPETFGLVVLEAWARERPVIATRLGSPQEIITPDRDGLLANPLDVASMAQCIQALIDSPDTSIAMGKAGKVKLINEFSEKLWLSRIESVYETILPS